MEDQTNNKGSENNNIASILGIQNQENIIADNKNMNNNEAEKINNSIEQNINNPKSEEIDKKPFFPFLNKDKAEENKTSFFGGLFCKKKKATVLNEQKKILMESKKDAKSGFSMFGPLAGSQKETKIESPSTQENAFTKIFKNDESTAREDDFIDTIIESAKKQQEKRRDEDKTKSFTEITESFKTKKKKEEIQVGEKKIEHFAKAAQIILICSIFVPIISFAFFHSILVPDNFVSNSFGFENYGKKLETSNKNVADLTKEISDIENETKALEKKITDIQENAVLRDILSKRINWLSVISKVEEIANKEFHNNVTNVVTFTNYSGRSSKSEISVQGYVKDPGGMSFTQLTKLVKAMNSSKNFSGAEVRSFAKSEDKDGSAKSTFNLTFIYENDVEDEWKEKL